MKDFFTIGRQQLWIGTIISVCVVAAALCFGWMTWSGSDAAGESGDWDTGTASGQELQADENPQVSGGKDLQTGTAPAEEENTEASGTVIASPSSYELPVKGNVFRAYSRSELTYFPTLNQYMTHSGIDILAPEGTEVCAAAEGLVSKVTDDRAMGKTVWIAHQGEIITVYSNLSENITVEEGDAVTKGQVIGTAGSTSLYEKSDEPHIHVEVLVGGNPADPADYFEY
ncbi:MAG: M23 family metallopeptidase [Bacillota bacterium]|nr:M23 family metallopeptidase [Bacillota bacterium]